MTFCVSSRCDHLRGPFGAAKVRSGYMYTGSSGVLVIHNGRGDCITTHHTTSVPLYNYPGHTELVVWWRRLIDPGSSLARATQVD